jgi:hypothetical protein
MYVLPILSSEYSTYRTQRSSLLSVVVVWQEMNLGHCCMGYVWLTLERNKRQVVLVLPSVNQLGGVKGYEADFGD